MMLVGAVVAVVVILPVAFEVGISVAVALAAEVAVAELTEPEVATESVVLEASDADTGVETAEEDAPVAGTVEFPDSGVGVMPAGAELVGDAVAVVSDVVPAALGLVALGLVPLSVVEAVAVGLETLAVAVTETPVPVKVPEGTEVAETTELVGTEVAETEPVVMLEAVADTEMGVVASELWITLEEVVFTETVVTSVWLDCVTGTLVGVGVTALLAVPDTIALLSVVVASDGDTVLVGEVAPVSEATVSDEEVATTDVGNCDVSVDTIDPIAVVAELKIPVPVPTTSELVATGMTEMTEDVAELVVADCEVAVVSVVESTWPVMVVADWLITELSVVDVGATAPVAEAVEAPVPADDVGGMMPDRRLSRSVELGVSVIAEAEEEVVSAVIVAACTLGDSALEVVPVATAGSPVRDVVVADTLLAATELVVPVGATASPVKLAVGTDAELELEEAGVGVMMVVRPMVIPANEVGVMLIGVTVTEDDVALDAVADTEDEVAEYDADTEDEVAEDEVGEASGPASAPVAEV